MSISRFNIPLSVLCDRNLSAFESVIEYLKDVEGLTYREIAVLTNRDDTTIWTTYNRAKKKREAGTSEEKIIVNEVVREKIIRRIEMRKSKSSNTSNILNENNEVARK